MGEMSNWAGSWDLLSIHSLYFLLTAVAFQFQSPNFRPDYPMTLLLGMLG
jgi:hypothetical protein